MADGGLDPKTASGKGALSPLGGQPVGQVPSPPSVVYGGLNGGAAGF